MAARICGYLAVLSIMLSSLSSNTKSLADCARAQEYASFSAGSRVSRVICRSVGRAGGRAGERVRGRRYSQGGEQEERRKKKRREEGRRDRVRQHFGCVASVSYLTGDIVSRTVQRQERRYLLQVHRFSTISRDYKAAKNLSLCVYACAYYIRVRYVR